VGQFLGEMGAAGAMVYNCLREELRLSDDTCNHIRDVCRPSSGAKTCRYLIAPDLKWKCARGSGELADYIDVQAGLGKMTAQAVGCSGKTL
jgi:hypothetical protein